MYFDSVIGNPPYEGRGFLYTKILYTTWDNSKRVSWLCPTTFVDGVYKRNETFNAVIRTFEKNLDKFEDVDPSGFDMQVAQDSLGIFYFSDNCTEPVDMNDLCWRKYDSPEKIKNIYEKIKNYCKENNLRKKRLAPKKVIGTAPKPDPNFVWNPDKWYVGCSWVRGTIGDWTWITLLGEKDLPVKGGGRESWFHVWEFDNEEGANNFREYLNNSDILKFSVHLEKLNQTNNPNSFSYYPMPKSFPWKEEELIKDIGITEEELYLIKSVLNKYPLPKNNTKVS